MDNESNRESEPELKPCPFCGGLKIVKCDDDGLFWKRCTSCGATGPETTKYSGEEGDSFVDWNTRAGSQPPDEIRRQALEEAARLCDQAETNPPRYDNGMQEHGWNDATVYLADAIRALASSAPASEPQPLDMLLFCPQEIQECDKCDLCEDHHVPRGESQ